MHHCMFGEMKQVIHQKRSQTRQTLTWLFLRQPRKTRTTFLRKPSQPRKTTTLLCRKQVMWNRRHLQKLKSYCFVWTRGKWGSGCGVSGAAKTRAMKSHATKSRAAMSRTGKVHGGRRKNTKTPNEQHAECPKRNARTNLIILAMVAIGQAALWLVGKFEELPIPFSEKVNFLFSCR